MFTLKLTRLYLAPFSLNFRKPLKTAKGEYSSRHGLYLKGETSSGLRGFGELSPLPDFSSESLADAEVNLRGNVRTFLGQSIPTTRAELSEQTKRRGLLPSVRFALEMLYADLAAQAAGKSTAEWTTKGASSSIPVNALLSGSEEELDVLLEEKISAGFSVFKLKVATRDIPVELSLISRLVPVLRGRGKLRLDCNQGLSFSDARAFLAGLAPIASVIDYVEEPLKAEEAHPEDLGMLVEESPVKIALDESLEDAVMRDLLLSRKYCHVAVLKPMLLGGITETLDIAEHAARKGLEVVLTSMLESPLGLAACVHTAGACRVKLLPCGFGTLSLFERSGAAEELPIVEGHICVPENHGLGVQPAPGKWDEIR